jgi:hypothetical protein
MSAEPFLLELEVRGFVPWDGGDELAGHVSSAFFRRGTATGTHDLVLVVDRTNPEGLPGDPSAPHRTNRRPGPFTLPIAEVLRLAKQLPTTFVAPLRRVTLVEIADVPESSDDMARIDSYVSPKEGTTLLGAAYVDTVGKSVRTNDAASPVTSGLVYSDDPADWARKAYGAPLSDAPLSRGVALFGPRAVGAVSFFLSPVAGAALLSWNLYRTRRAKLGIGLFGATAFALFALTIAGGDGDGGHAMALGANIGANIGAMFLLVKATRELFGDPLRKASSGLALLLGVASLVVVVGGGMTAAVALEMASETELATSNGAKVTYDRHTTADHARRVGELFCERKILTGKTSGVRLEQRGKDHVVRLAFGDAHVHEEPGVMDFYKEVARELSADVFGGEHVRIVFEDDYGVEQASVRAP